MSILNQHVQFTVRFEEINIADAEVVYSDDICDIVVYIHSKQAEATNNPFITDGFWDIPKRAENEVHSYIMAKIYLPLTEIPALIEHATDTHTGYMDYP